MNTLDKPISVTSRILRQNHWRVTRATFTALCSTGHRSAQRPCPLPLRPLRPQPHPSRTGQSPNSLYQQFQARTHTMSSVGAMSKRLTGKTIVITGASSGIGRSTALEFARTAPTDLRLILTARRIDVLKKIAEEITSEVGKGVKVLPVQLDVSKADEIEAFVGKLPEEWRAIDVLVNNAGMVQGVEQSPDIVTSDIQMVMDTNVHGLINMTQAVMKVYKARGKSGQGDIINVGSIAGREGYIGGSIYCASKAAVRIFTEALRKELMHTRIRVMEIDPGQVETNFSVVRFRGDKEKAAAVYANCEPLTPDDIAEVIVFMAGRRENVVIADSLVFPNHQGAATTMHRNA